MLLQSNPFESILRLLRGGEEAPSSPPPGGTIAPREAAPRADVAPPTQSTAPPVQRPSEPRLPGERPPPNPKLMEVILNAGQQFKESPTFVDSIRPFFEREGIDLDPEIAVSEFDLPDGVAAMADVKGNKIVLSPNLDPREVPFVMFHEVGHFLPGGADTRGERRANRSGEQLADAFRQAFLTVSGRDVPLQSLASPEQTFKLVNLLREVLESRDDGSS